MSARRRRQFREPAGARPRRALVRRLVVVVVAAVCGACQPPARRVPAGVAEEGRGLDPRALAPLEQVEPGPLPVEAVEPPSPPSARVQRRIERAAERLAERRFTEALGELDKAARYEPDSPVVRRWMGIVGRLSGSLVTARAHLDAAVREWPADAEARYHLARIALQEGDLDEAIQQLRTARGLVDRSASPVLARLIDVYLGQALVDRGYLRAGLDLLREAWAGLSASDVETAPVTLRPDVADISRVELARRMGEAALRLGEPQAALGALEEAAALSGATPDVLELLARVYHALGKTDAALAAASRCVALLRTPDQIDALQRLYRDLGEEDRLVEELGTRLRAGTLDTALQVMFAELLQRRGRADEALEVLRALASREDAPVEVWERLVALQVGGGDATAALETLVEAVRRSAERADWVRDEVHRLVGRVGRAGVEAFLGGGEQRDAAKWFVQGLVLEATGRADEAREAFQAARRLDPEFTPALTAEMDLQIRRYAWDAVIALADAALEQGLVSAGVYARKARALDALDDYAAAERAYQQALKLDPRDLDTREALARMLERRGEPLRARREYQAILAADPTRSGTRERLIRMLLSEYVEGSSDAPAGRQDLLAEAVRQLNEMRRQSGADAAHTRCAAYLNFLQDRERPETRDGALAEYRRRLEEVLQAHPDEWRTHADLARALIWAGDYEPALRHARRVQELAPQETVGGELEWVIHQYRLAFDEAIATGQRLIARYPNRVGWLRRLAGLYVVQMRYDEAAEVLARAAEVAPDRPTRQAVLLEWLEALVLGGQEQRVRDVLEQAERTDVETDFLRRTRLYVLRYLGHADEGVEAARAWYEAEPDETAVRTLYVQALQFAQRWDALIARVLLWMEEDPNNAWLNAALAEALIRSGRVEEGLELARSQAQAVGDTLEAKFNLATHYEQAGRYAEAAEQLKQIVRELGGDPRSFQLVARLAEMLARARELDDAMHYVDLIEQAGVGPEAVARLRYAVYSVVGRRADALALLEQQYEMTPQDPGINNDLGYLLAEMGRDLERAEQMCRFAVGQRPRVAAYLDSLGWVLYRRGAVADAQPWLVRALAGREVPDRPVFFSEPGGDPVIHEHMGDVLWRLGRREEARAHWEQALRRLEAMPAPNADEQRSLEAVRARLSALREGRAPEVAPIVGEAGTVGTRAEPAPAGASES